MVTVDPAVMPFRDLMSRHASREARREGISLEEIEETYVSPDATRPSGHDDEREVRTRYFGDRVIEIVVDTIDGRVVTTWRKGSGT
jgi:hypothetical protein